MWNFKRTHCWQACKRIEDIGISSWTVNAIKETKKQISSFVSSTKQGQSAQKIFKTNENSVVKTALYIQFLQEWCLTKPISGPILQEEENCVICSNRDFKASAHWLHNFKKWHGIGHLSINKQKKNNANVVKLFRLKFLTVLQN